LKTLHYRPSLSYVDECGIIWRNLSQKCPLWNLVEWKSIRYKGKNDVIFSKIYLFKFYRSISKNKETTKNKGNDSNMGLWRVMWTGCLGMLCLIPLAWFSFNVLDLGAAITGSLFIGIGDAIDTAFSLVPLPGFLAGFIPFIIQGIMGIILLWFFPLHWALYYRPDDITMALAIVLPWLLVGTITAALFCKKARQGFDTGVAIGLAYALFIGLFPFIIQAIINAATGGMGLGVFNIMDVFNGLFSGMTDLPYIWAVITSCLEGGLIAGVFGALIGSLKYKPGNQLETTKVKKAKKKKEEPKISAVTDTSGSTNTSGIFCPNCRSKVVPGDPFCPNCGSKL